MLPGPIPAVKLSMYPFIEFALCTSFESVDVIDLIAASISLKLVLPTLPDINEFLYAL